MIIREAESKDASALSNLLGQLGYPTSDSSSLEKIMAYSKEGYRMLMAESDQKVIGFISLHWYVSPHLPGPVGRITAFCMDEQVRGQGNGTTLLDAAEEFFKKVDCFKIEVTSNLKRIRTHQYYTNLGYDQISMHFVKFLKALDV
jgi:N-acetylglutamate synthase-like GNAT family acetyltransferase